MLEARLRRGWTPTPTSTVDGDQVLGHACKVAKGASLNRWDR
jgi:hypothetical protein